MCNPYIFKLFFKRKSTVGSLVIDDCWTKVSVPITKSWQTALTITRWLLSRCARKDRKQTDGWCFLAKEKNIRSLWSTNEKCQRLEKVNHLEYILKWRFLIYRNVTVIQFCVSCIQIYTHKLWRIWFHFKWIHQWNKSKCNFTLLSISFATKNHLYVI